MYNQLHNFVHIKVTPGLRWISSLNVLPWCESCQIPKALVRWMDAVCRHFRLRITSLNSSRCDKAFFFKKKKKKKKKGTKKKIKKLFKESPRSCWNQTNDTEKTAHSPTDIESAHSPTTEPGGHPGGQLTRRRDRPRSCNLLQLSCSSKVEFKVFLYKKKYAIKTHLLLILWFCANLAWNRTLMKLLSPSPLQYMIKIEWIIQCPCMHMGWT